jgi:hypothetical protein
MALDLIGVGAGELMANPFASDSARQLVQVQRNLQPLLAGHASVEFELALEGRIGVHKNCALTAGVGYVAK